MTEKLMPCECGGDAVLFQSSDGDVDYVHCLACTKEGPRHYSSREAITAWNARHPTPAADEVEIAELIECTLFNETGMSWTRAGEVAKIICTAISAMQARSAEHVVFKRDFEAESRGDLTEPAKVVATFTEDGMGVRIKAAEPASNPCKLPAEHPDDIAVDQFAAAMKEKLARKRAEGRGGWQNRDECSAERLSSMLRDHVGKGDPVDVANFAMMLHQRDERIVPAEPAGEEPAKHGPGCGSHNDYPCDCARPATPTNPERLVEAAEAFMRDLNVNLSCWPRDKAVRVAAVRTLSALSAAPLKEGS